MDTALLDENWAKLSASTRFAIKSYARYPTERNTSYITGYIGACGDNWLINDEGYWLAAIHTVEAREHIKHLEV